MLTIKRLDLAEARILIKGATEKANEIGVPMSIAVTDESSNLVAFERMDGAKITSVDIAIDKGYTAAGIRNPTHKLGEASQPGKPAYGISTANGGRMQVIAGGLPVLDGDDVIGAIGVSSGSPDQDLMVAQAGVQALLESS